MKLKFKITVIFTVLVTALLLLLSFSVYYFSSLERSIVFKRRLKGRATTNAQLYSILGDPTGRSLRHIDSATVVVLARKSVVISNYLGQVLYQYDEPGVPPLVINRQLLNDTRTNGEVYFKISGRDAYAYHYTDPRNRFVIAVAGYDEDGLGRLQAMKQILIFSLLVGIGLTWLVGSVFSKQLVRPISQIISEVKSISSHDLSRRIRANKGPDELSQLASTFNELLARLQDSFNSQRRFISNASHELSTPLTSISSQLEVTLQNTRTKEEYEEVLQSILEDVKQLQQLTKSLLEIAKTGSQGSMELHEVRIDELLFKIMSDVQRLSPEYQVILHFGDFPEDEKSFLVFGNADLLYSSLKNIVENGCKYSPDNTSLVELSFVNDQVIISVRNLGEGIPQDEIENIFQPFYRSTAAVSVKGFGLGLALARRIIALHKGTIIVRSNPHTGTDFIVTLPSLKIFK